MDRAGGRSRARWRRTIGVRAESLRLVAPARARHPGSYTVVITASVAGETSTKRVGVSFVAG